MKRCSNSSTKASTRRSSSESACSPTIAIRRRSSWPRPRKAEIWSATPRWSPRVLPAPIPAFMRRLSDGRTSIGGAMPRRSSSRDRTICPSVMYPVTSGIGCVTSSSGIERIGQLGHRAAAPADAPGALEQRREVGVHVAGIAAPARHLVACGGGLAQGLAVVGHVDEHDEHVQAALEREVLGRRQRGPRAGEPLGRGIVGVGDEDDGPLERGPVREAVAHERGLAIGHADRGEDDDEAFVGAAARAPLARSGSRARARAGRSRRRPAASGRARACAARRSRRCRSR